MVVTRCCLGRGPRCAVRSVSTSWPSGSTPSRPALAGLGRTRYPNGPVYFGDHTGAGGHPLGRQDAGGHPRRAISPWLVLDGLWETHVTGWLQQTLRPGQVFVDVGANVGYFTLLGGQPGRPARTGGGRRGPPRPGRAAAAQRGHERAPRLRHHLAPGRLVEPTTLQLAPAPATSPATRASGPSAARPLDRLGDTEEMVEVEAVARRRSARRAPARRRAEGGRRRRRGPGLHRAGPDPRGQPRRSPSCSSGRPHRSEAVGDKAEALLDLLTGHGLRFRLLEDDLAPIERSRLLDLPYGNVVATR